MIEEPSLGEVYRTLLALKEDTRDGLGEITDQLKALNGRVYKTESRVSVLEDRSTRTEAKANISADTATAANTTAKKWTLIMGAVGAFLSALFAKYL